MDDLLDEAMVLSDDPNESGLKTNPDELMEEDEDKLLDFGDFISTSKSKVKYEPTEMGTLKTPVKTAEEVIVEEPVLFSSRI